jgi:predicted alpha/beta-hydrolase family hydrolase
MPTSDEPVTIPVGAGTVSGLLREPALATALYVLAHGAGAGMRHPFMARIAELLADRGVATLRYQFPYMEAKKGRPDSPAVATAAVRSAVAFARGRRPELPLFAGGKSFGGRMTSTAAAAEPLDGIRGLVFLGFPLHPPKKPSIERAEHLDRVAVPMLFLQGTRDDLADLSLLRPVLERIGPRARLHVIDGADHSFAGLKSQGKSQVEILAGLADSITEWMSAR